jgi:hypothetical protein
MVPVGSKRVSFLMRSLEFSTDILPTGTMVLGSTQPLTEMTTRDLPGGIGQPAH